MNRGLFRAVLGLVLIGPAAAATAQPLGTFSWQLAPYCNVVTVNVTQTGSTYTIDGYDTQCGGTNNLAPVTGMAVPNPNGSIGLGFTIVTSPGGTPVHVDATLDLATLGGTWRDSIGGTGPFVFTPAGSAAGSPRPIAAVAVPDGSITTPKIADGAVNGVKLTDGSVTADDIADGTVGVSEIDPAQVQRRVLGTCPAGQLMTHVNQDGSVVCAAVTSTGGGDITAVAAGSGLTGGGTTGDVSVAANFSQVQARIATGCPTDQFMRVVNADGSVQCAAPPASGTNFIQNGTTPQAASFNITGTGTVAGVLTAGAVLAPIVRAGVQFDVLQGRVLGVQGTQNLFVGVGAGAGNTTGRDNTIVGFEAGAVNAVGEQNTFVGTRAGASTSAWSNTLVGHHAGQDTTTGSDNAFVGADAGRENTTGSDNTFVGDEAGFLVVTGSRNTYVGSQTATFAARDGSDDNVLLGYRADLSSTPVINAAAIGARARVESSNAIVLGSIAGVNTATDSVRVGIGTTTPNSPLDIEADRAAGAVLRLTNSGRATRILTRSSGGEREAPAGTLINDELFRLDVQGHTGSAFSVNGGASMLVRATENWTATANGSAIDFFTTPNGTDAPVQRMVIAHDGRVGIGRSAIQQTLDVNGNVRVGVGGGSTGCIEDRDGTVIAGTCASDARFKRDIRPLAPLLDRAVRLRPVSYYWRTSEHPTRHFGDRESFGLIAQDVEPVFPDLVATDADGFKAVNYTKLPLITLQALIELKAENDALKARIDRQQGELDALRQLVEGVGRR